MLNTQALLALIITMAIGWPPGGAIQEAKADDSYYIRVDNDDDHHHKYRGWSHGHHKHHKKHHEHHRHYYHGYYGPNTYQFHPPVYGVYRWSEYYQFRPIPRNGHTHIIIPQPQYYYDHGSVEFRSNEFDIRLGW